MKVRQSLDIEKRSDDGVVKVVEPHRLIGIQALELRLPILYQTWSAPGRARTCNPVIRSHILYPIELRVRCGWVGCHECGGVQGGINAVSAVSADNANIGNE